MLVVSWLIIWPSRSVQRSEWIPKFYLHSPPWQGPKPLGPTVEPSTEQRESHRRWLFLGRNATTPCNTTRLELLQSEEQNKHLCRQLTSRKTFPWLSWLPPGSQVPPSVQLSWSWSEVHSAMSPDILQYGRDTSLRPTGNRVRVIRSVLCCRTCCWMCLFTSASPSSSAVRLFFRRHRVWRLSPSPQVILQGELSTMTSCSGSTSAGHIRRRKRRRSSNTFVVLGWAILWWILKKREEKRDSLIFFGKNLKAFIHCRSSGPRPQSGSITTVLDTLSLNCFCWVT